MNRPWYPEVGDRFTVERKSKKSTRTFTCTKKDDEVITGAPGWRGSSYFRVSECLFTPAAAAWIPKVGDKFKYNYRYFPTVDNSTYVCGYVDEQIVVAMPNDSNKNRMFKFPIHDCTFEAVVEPVRQPISNELASFLRLTKKDGEIQVHKDTCITYVAGKPALSNKVTVYVEGKARWDGRMEVGDTLTLKIT